MLLWEYGLRTSSHWESRAVFSNTRESIQYCKKDGSFVFGASNAVTMETPVENYFAMIKA